MGKHISRRPAQFSKMVRLHKLWVDSAGTRGERAVFDGFDLTNSQFRNCNFRYADFRGADLKGVAFISCDLRGALFDSSAMDVESFFYSKWLKTDIPWYVSVKPPASIEMEVRICGTRLRWKPDEVT